MLLRLKNFNFSVASAKKHLVAWIVILVMIYGSGDSSLGWIGFVRYGLIGINFMITMILCLKKKRLNAFMVKVYAVMCITVFASMVVNQDFHGYTMWIIMAIALFTEEAIEYDIFYQVFENIIFFFSICSLLGMVLWFTAPEVVLAFPEIDICRNLIVTTIPTVYKGFTFRNFGIFREPAMFCIYLGLALTRQFFCVEKLSVKKCIVFLITIITTRSATGYIGVIFLLAAFFVLKKKSRKECGFCVLIIMGIVAANRALGLMSYLMNRMDPESASAYSLNSRVYSVVCGLMAGFTDPLFGRGATKSNDVFAACVKLVDTTGEGGCWANMVTYFFASFGIVFIAVFLLGLFGMTLSYKKSRIIAFVNLIFIVLLLCGETMTYSATMFTFMMYGLRNLREHGILKESSEAIIDTGRCVKI